jgi:hypothetical protein
MINFLLRAVLVLRGFQCMIKFVLDDVVASVLPNMVDAVCLNLLLPIGTPVNL